jgi:FAD:protein FMN transferase
MAQIINRGNVSRDDLIAGGIGCSTGSVSDLSFDLARAGDSGCSCSPYCTHFRRSAVLSIFLLLVLFCYAPAQTKLIRYEDSRISMACTYSIVAYGDDLPKLKQAVTEAFDEVDRIDRLMSHYKPDSPLSQINREAAKHPVKVEEELLDFLGKCKHFSRLTDGAFDITVGPLMKAWGFFRGEGRMPSEEELAQVKKVVGYQHLLLDYRNNTVRFDREGLELDLGGVAKGYAVDRASLILQRNNIRRALISAGGSTIYAMGSPPESDAWEVQIQDPLDARKIAMTVKLRNQVLSVSGSAEKFFELKGKRYSHIMNPRTGRPVMNVLSVVFITRNGAFADAFDNAFYVMGVKKTEKFLRWIGDVQTEVFFFLPDKPTTWKMVHLKNN